MRNWMVLGMLALAGCCFFGENGKAPISAVSPDGKNEIRLWTNPLAYEVSRAGKVLVAKTEIGMKVDGKCLASGSACCAREEHRSGSVGSPVYKKAKVDMTGNEVLVGFGDWAIRLAARNDGVAYRFETKFPGEVTVDCEKAGFTLCPKAECYVNYNWFDFKGDPLQNSWESVTEKHLAGELKVPEGNIAYLPFVFKAADGTAVCVTESDLVDYPGWNLKNGEADKGVLFRGEFAKFPKKVAFCEGWGKYHLDPNTRLRSQKVLEREDFLVKTKGTRTFPWRCFQIGADASKLVESDLVWALATPNKAGDDKWIKPGKVAWDWWNAFDNLGEEKGCTTKGYERFIDFAAKNGVEYVIFDEGWSEKLNIWKYHPRVDVPHLIKYAKERGVGIILWMAWAQVVGEEEKVASYFAKLGAKGFKVDFMDRDDAACVNFLWKFADACAKEHMLVDYHGMFKPTGMERAYPNVLNFEGIHGLEQTKWYTAKWDMMASDVKSYFVRMSAGPLDYTPGAMDNYPVGPKELYKGTHTNPGSIGTRCRQMAMMTLYFAPLQMLCDSPTKYEKNLECFKFMAETPVVWDDTIGLKGDPDTMCACARRKGDVWYAAGMTNADGRDYELDTSFLGAGQWKAEVFRDATDSDVTATHYVHERGKSVKAGDKLAFRMAKGGGFVVKFTK